MENLEYLKELQFEEPLAEDAHLVAPFYTMRPNRTCDTGVIDTFIWKDYYKIRYCIAGEEALLMLMQNDNEYFTALPYCSSDKLEYYFNLLTEYFNQVLKQPLKVYLADEEGVMHLKLKENERFIVREEEDFKDYLYSGEELRTLAGKTHQKKRNLISRFNRDLEGRWEYRSLSCSDRDEINLFFDRWFDSKDTESGEETLRYEQKGIYDLIQDCCQMEYKAGGVFIDGVLEAISIGSMNEAENMGVISVEKANPAFTGIYQVINQQFLLHEFPDAVLVNREDDMGMEGLRKAKMSYHPVDFARKYMIQQKTSDGTSEDILDYYEDEIARDSRSD